MLSHFKTLNFIAAFVLLMKPQLSSAQAWVAENTWTPQTEVEYAEWFKKNATSKFFVDKDNLLANRIGVDCGKAVYSFRAVFAFEKKLPFKIIGTNQKWMDAQTGNYAGSTPNEKLISFLRTVVENTSVESFKYNTFPIALHKNSTTSGVLFTFQMPGSEEDKAGRHAYILKDIDQSGVPHFIYATVPARPRPLSERRVFPFFVPVNPNIDNQWGFRRFFQPQDYEVFANMKTRLKGLDINSPAAEQILRDVPAELRARGYDPSHQRKVTESVFKYYEERVEFFLNGPKNPGISEKIDLGLKPKSELDKAAAMRLWKKMNDPNYREVSIVDEILEDYRKILLKKYHDQIESRKRMIEEYNQLNPNEKRINVPALIKSGTFVSDPPNAPYDLTITGLYAQQLINIFATNKEESLGDRLKRNFFNLCGYSQDRAQAVKEGYNYFFGLKIVTASDKFERCPTKDEVYDYTTHERDAELTSFIGDARKHYLANKPIIKRQFANSWYLVYERIFNNGQDFANNPTLMKQAEDFIIASQDTPSNERCEIEISKSKTLSIWQVVSIMGAKGQASPAPWQDVNMRWGLVKFTPEQRVNFDKFECENKE